MKWAAKKQCRYNAGQKTEDLCKLVLIYMAFAALYIGINKCCSKKTINRQWNQKKRKTRSGKKKRREEKTEKEKERKKKKDPAKKTRSFQKLKANDKRKMLEDLEYFYERSVINISIWTL